MDEMANRAILIAVSVFVTIAIVSGVFYVINQMTNIYSQVYETDISIQSSFSEFEQYENSQKSGIDVLNAIKKYRENPNVKIKLGAQFVNETSSIYTEYISKTGEEERMTYLSSIGEVKYTSQVELDENTGVTTIIFIKK